MPEKETVYVGYVLRGQHFHTATGGCRAIDEAIDLVKSHFGHDINVEPDLSHWRQSPDLDFRIYRSDAGSWKPTIVEVGPDAKRPMMVLAVYKIIEGQVDAAPASDAG